jgi:hypothetical protein
MLLNRATAEGIRDGSVTAVFRRWEVPRARPGGTQRTVAGVIRFTSVEPVVGELTDEDARSAGLPSVPALRKADRGDRGGRLYRIGVTFDRPDERVSLREQLPSAADTTAIDEALDRLDRGRRTGPWTREILQLIASRPGVRAPDLAESLGRDTRPFKADVRKLKELGLTHSLEVGYELSPRGRAYLGPAAPDQGRQQAN